MSKSTKYQITFLIIACLLLFVFYVFSTKSFKPVNYQITNQKPNIQTENTATSSKTIIVSPSNYKSEIITTYDGNKYNTYATSTPLTQQDITDLHNKIQKQQNEMQKIFLQQQALFDQQEKLFRNLMNSF